MLSKGDKKIPLGGPLIVFKLGQVHLVTVLPDRPTSPHV